MTPLSIELPAKDPLHRWRWLALPVMALPLPFTAIPWPYAVALVAAGALGVAVLTWRASEQQKWRRITIDAGGQAVLIARTGEHEQQARLDRVLVFPRLGAMIGLSAAGQGGKIVLYLPRATLSPDLVRRLRILSTF